MRAHYLSVAALLSAATPALAHPHMFFDTTLSVIFNAERQAASVRITWVYDELTSLQYIADLGLDVDGDGVLTPEERTRLAGFDMQWDAGFAGDSYALMGDQPLGLSRPRAPTADYGGGRIITTHIRDLAVPQRLENGQELIIQVYDPSFFAAYTLVKAEAEGAPPGCSAQAYAPDRSAADEALLAALAEYTPDQEVEQDFPAIGAAYAEELRITCKD